MQDNPIHNPHDKLFRASLQYKEVAKEFLEMNLPIDIKNKINLNNIKHCNTTFIDAQLKLSQSDVLLKTTFNDKDAYVYILAEHQFTVNKLMPFRLLKYMVNIWEFHIKQANNQDCFPLPVIIPLVFYTGEGDYSGCRIFTELFAENSKIMEQLLTSPFNLIDVNKLPEKDLISHIWAGTMSFIMRKRFRQHLKSEILKIVDNLNIIGLDKHDRFVIELMKYILNIDDEHRDIKEFISLMHNKLQPKLEEEFMTLADHIAEKGRQEGLQTGRQEGIMDVAIKLLQENTDPVFVARITGLPLEQIKKINFSNANGILS